MSCADAGSVHTLPRFTSPKVRSMLDSPDIKSYSDLASAYGSDNPDKLLRVAEQHMTTFSNVSEAPLPAASQALICSQSSLRL